MDGHEFIEVAKSLAHSQREAWLRSAVSRAYYALLNSAIQFLSELGFSVEQGPGAHGQTRNRLSNSTVEQMMDFSRILDELRKRRNKADYDMSSSDFTNQATCALRAAKAESALALLVACKHEPQRSRIRAEIREYERLLGAA